MTKEERNIVERAIEKKKEFTKEDEFLYGKYMMSEVKNILVNQKPTLSVNTNENKNSREVYIEIFRYYISEILNISVAEYDAIFSDDVNKQLGLRSIINKINSTATDKELVDGWFNSKKTLLRICYPEYYKEHYPQDIRSFDIFRASGELARDLKRIGKSKMVCSGARYQNNGKLIDELVYDSMKRNLPSIGFSSTKEMFEALANPKKWKMNNLGFVKIIEQRNAYPTPLDFYFLNSPIDYQYEHFKEYLDARATNPNIPHMQVLDILQDVLQETKTPMKGFSYDL